jgi:hypothetical protein
MGWPPLSLTKQDLADGSLVRAADASWDVPIKIQLLRPRFRQSTTAEAF